ncbi:SNF2-related protein [Acidovorax sp. FJL06]|uniref:SNF2-related protein n=1 Tax=Acidovorax sp. FJL06 TaxID=2153365 RepID=UPI000F561EF8|nr:SNF2-related protein [Acidovorax sp. FJL06]RQO83584.1 helicase SNF2 [Acidovorax sp. FJL06]
MYTRYQCGYLAHSLSLDGVAEDALTQTIAGAKVDMNPHQVDAALFALASPLSSGVILADEVGLGKTIEASLVLAQKWAEHKRHLLLVVPATLRKQWSQELVEKFSLPSKILEARNFKEAQAGGVPNPFLTEVAFGESAVVICSYEFASRKQAELAAVPWDLVVFDEAHKLRNFYRGESAKIASRLDAALKGRTKLLLSATPLQNNLQELYGLISIIDPHFFGSLDAFKARYCRPKLEAAEFEHLRERLKTVCKRTLRRQVQETGGIKFTRRYSMTEDFRPSDAELTLYKEVSDYLQRDDLLSIKPGARHLVTLVIRKILASSSFAIQGTLSTMIERLEKKLSFADALEDYDALSDLTDEEGSEEEDDADPISLAAEIDQLKNFLSLAEHIAQDAKADALLSVLGKAFDFAERLGGKRKAVIFTESVRTQSKLKQLLAGNGYTDKIAILNGSNADPDSRRILQDWLKRHEGSGRISGAKTADMKAALVDHFRESAEILICTEAGAEGINLQFCSLLINYDLPWNPQRVEQRIGRVHRYGQKHDVVVVNFINKGNRADERVFELLSEKFQLFEGVFGASDEILGTIESGVDIERRIHDIYQRCRNDAQIDEEFNQLQATFKTEIEARTQETRRSLLENFDVDVVKRLNVRRDKTEQHLSEYQERLLMLARMMLPDAPFEAHRIQHESHWYDVRWQEAEDTQARFLRPNEGLGADLIAKAKQSLIGLPMATLEFDLSHADSGQHSWLQHFAGQTGELVVEKLSLATANRSIEHLLVAARSDAGEVLDTASAERLLTLPAHVQSEESEPLTESALAQQLTEQEAQQMQAAEHLNEGYFAKETEKLESWAEDRRIALDIRIRQLDQQIKEARKAARQLPSLQEKLSAKRALKQLEQTRDRLMLDYHEEKKQIDAEEDRLLTAIEAALQITPQRQRLFAIRWRLKERP